MSAFTALELDYLHGARRLARIATLGKDGTPHVVPVGFTHNRERDTIDVGGRDFAQTKKFRDVSRSSRAAIVIDDLASTDPWRPRGIEVRGRAEALTDPLALIRIHPERIVSWGIEPNRQARSVGREQGCESFEIPAWTKKNFDDLRDVSPQDAQMQWRFAREALRSPELGVSRFTYDPGARMPWGHRHRVQEEAYVVVAGSGRAKLDDEVVDLSVWDVLRVAPAVVRSFEAGPEGLDVICIGGRKPEGRDSERFEDFWD